MKKSWIPLVLSSLLLLSACAPAAPAGNTASSAAAENPSSEGMAPSAGESAAPAAGGVLRVMISEEPGAEDALGNALKSWSEETGNKVEQIILSHGDMASKFPAMAKNKDLPDLIATTGLHQRYPDEFVDMNTVLDLSQFNEAALKIVGKSYTSDMITGIPNQFTTTCVYYNKDAFAAAGLTAPSMDAPWTWEELYENASVLQEKGGVKYGFAADVSRARYDVLMYAGGGSLVEKDGDSFKVAVNSPENIATLARFVQANNEVMPKAIWAGGTTDNPVEYFKNGDAAILLSGSWNYNKFFNDITNFEFGLLPSPKGEAGRSAIIGGEALAIPTNGKNTDLAKEFVRWLFTEENYSKFLQLRKEASVMKAVSYTPDTDKAREDFVYIQKEAEYVTDTFMVDESSSWRTFKNDEYRDTLKRAVAGELTPEEALNDFAQELSEASGWSMKY